MTLEEVDGALPNGLHDAEIEQLAFDFENGRVTMRLNAWVGAGSDLERYRKGLLGFSGVAFFALETPKRELPFRQPAGLDFSWKRTNLAWMPPLLAQEMRPDLIAYSIFIHDYLADFNIVAASVDFEWLAGEEAAPSR